MNIAFRRGWPLFLRIFAVMMATLLLVQLLNFTLVVLVPPPRPPVTTIERIVAALRGANVEDLRREPGATPAADTMHPHAQQLRQILARQLGLGESDVRLHLEDRMRAPMGLAWRVERMPMGPPEPGFGRGFRNPEIVMGEFAASARIEGAWRTVVPARSEINPWRWRALLWLAVAMLVVTPFAWILARGLARPIGLFATAAERLGRDLKSPPLALEGSPELVHAAAAFNEMQARLSRYVEDRTTFMAAIAHDLRTPLMRLRLRLESAEAPVRDACEPDIRDMEQMIASVMAFLRDMQQHPRRRLDLRALAESVSHHFIDLGGEVVLQDGLPLVVEGDAAGLKSLFANLIGNAVKYAGAAQVRLYAEENEAIIEVSDDGPGMSDEDLVRAFEPFFRAERSRNRETGGIGLGLASVRAVARAHGGEAVIANRREGGLIVHVAIPMPAVLAC